MLFCSCNSNKDVSEIKTKEETILPKNDKISFDFSVIKDKSFQNKFEIKAKLYNKTSDTIYFLSSTCDGEQYSLKFDSLKIEIEPFMYCNASFPKVLKIAPKDEYNFKTYLNCKDSIIKLGFDFYQVDKNFNIANTSLSKIHNRNKKDQNIHWSEKSLN